MKCRPSLRPQLRKRLPCPLGRLGLSRSSPSQWQLSQRGQVQSFTALVGIPVRGVLCSVALEAPPLHPKAPFDTRGQCQVTVESSKPLKLNAQTLPPETINLLSPSLNFIFIYYCCWRSHDKHPKVRGQLVELVLAFHFYVGFEDLTQTLGLQQASLSIKPLHWPQVSLIEVDTTARETSLPTLLQLLAGLNS